MSIEVQKSVFKKMSGPQVSYHIDRVIHDTGTPLREEQQYPWRTVRYLWSEPRALGKVLEYLETDKCKNRKVQYSHYYYCITYCLKFSGLKQPFYYVHAFGGSEI